MKEKWFYPQQHYEYAGEGQASYYGGRDIFHGRRMASGEVFDKNQLIVAHREIPIPSMVRVTNIDPKTQGFGRSIKAPVKDRGPFAHVHRRIIDVSEKTAKVLGFWREGTAKVRVEVLVDESIQLAQNSKTPLNPPLRLAQLSSVSPWIRPQVHSKFQSKSRSTVHSKAPYQNLKKRSNSQGQSTGIRVASLSQDHVDYLASQLPVIGPKRPPEISKEVLVNKIQGKKNKNSLQPRPIFLAHNTVDQRGTRLLRKP